MPTIAVDAMGGDFAPEAVVQAVADVSVATDIECVLVGDELRVQRLLEGVKYRPERIDILHAAEAIGMADEPRQAVATRRNASLLVAARAVGEGQAQALVSAGNTGACLLACLQHLPTIEGVRRPALASVYPRKVESEGQDPLALLLDVGATIRCEAADLLQFGLMGAAYARRISKVAAPRVGLLNMGREVDRGGDVLVEAHRRLAAAPGLNFVGNVEGHELLGGRADVVVCEGLLGNVVLKMLEGMGEVASSLAGAAQQKWRWKLGMSMLSSGVEKLRELVDFASYGGAPVLGFARPCIKAHPRSGPPALANAIKVAAKAVRDDVVGEIERALAQAK